MYWLLLFILFFPWTSYGYERVVSLSPQITESIYLLKAEDALVATTIFCKRPEEASIKNKVGTPLKPDIEKIVSLMPDIVFGSAEGNPPWVIERLKRLGINTYYFKRPKDFKDLCDNFLTLSSMLNRQKSGNEIVNNTRVLLERMSTDRRFRVLWQVGSEPFIAASRTSFANDIIKYAGGINIIDTDVPYPRVNIEEVVIKKPEVIVFMAMGYNIDSEKNRWGRYLKKPHFVIIDPYVAASPTPVTFLEAVRRLKEEGEGIKYKR